MLGEPLVTHAALEGLELDVRDGGVFGQVLVGHVAEPADLAGVGRGRVAAGAGERLLADLAAEPLAAPRVLVAVVQRVLAAREEDLVARAVRHQRGRLQALEWTSVNHI